VWFWEPDTTQALHKTHFLTFTLNRPTAAALSLAVPVRFTQMVLFGELAPQRLLTTSVLFRPAQARTLFTQTAQHTLGNQFIW
jgi:hypothetical protein